VDVRQVRIEIEIDEVLLYGFPAVDPDAVAASLQSELARLADEGGLNGGPAADVADAARDGGSFTLTSGRREQLIGTRVARATFRAVLDAVERRSRR
jgi:hypothetical protein